jgi:uncharacterized membrane protein
MDALFEAGKLTSFALLHRNKLPLTLKGALLTIGCLLVTLNVVGVSGQLSSSCVHRQIEGSVAAHNAQALAAGELEDLERQVAAADATMAKANEAKLKARDDRQRVRAGDAILKQAKADREALASKLTAARADKAKAEGEQMSAAGKFAAVTFVAAATGASTDRVANVVILIISAIPDLLAACCWLPPATSRGAKPPSGRRRAGDATASHAPSRRSRSSRELHAVA